MSQCKTLLLAQRWISTCPVRRITTTSSVCADIRNVRAGVPKITRKGNRPLTYEESQPPQKISHTKAWNSWNTSSLHEEERASLTAVEDYFIRAFIHGTFPRLLASHTVIKRRHNQVFIVAIINRKVQPRKVYFLIGYTEELLSCLLGCAVKLELQTVNDNEDVFFRYI